MNNNINIYAQDNLSKEWYIGLGKAKLVFSNDSVVNNIFSIVDSTFYYQLSGHSCICDTNGVLQIAMSPFVVFDGKSGTYANNGKAMCNDTFANFVNFQSNMANTTLLLPKGRNSYYYLSTTTNDSFMSAYINVGQGVFSYQMDELQYGIITVAENGQVSVAKKREVLLKDSKAFLNITNLTATRHANGRDWWIVKPSGDRTIRYRFLLRPDTILLYNTEQLPRLSPKFVWGSIGQSCFSQDGTLYAECNADSPTSIWGFDRCTGLFRFIRSFDLLKLNKDTTNPSPNASGVCFSADNRYLYQSEFFALYQLDLNEPNDTLALYCNCDADTSRFFAWNTSLFANPTGQLVLGHWHGISPLIDAIMQPLLFGKDATLKKKYARVAPFYGFTNNGYNDNPNTINYGLGKLVGSPCDTVKLAQSSYAQWAVWPNPTSGSLQLTVPVANANIVNITLHNALGQIVYQQTYGIDYTYKVNVQLGDIAAGIYYMHCITDNGSTYHQKLLKF